MNEVKDDVTNISIEIASRLIQKEITATDQKSLVDSYIKELNADGTK